MKLLHGWCYASSGVGWGWGGVGWGGDDNVPCTCTHGRCYATSCFLHLHTWLVLRNIMFLALAHMVGATQHHVSCTCTHGWCYATSCFLHLHTWSVLRNIMFFALAHMVGATQHHVSCTCTHGWCYATSCFLHLHTWSVLRNIMGWGGVGVGWGGVGMITFLALAHMVGATQHHVFCTCTHGWCYAISCFLHLHTWLLLRNIMFVDVNVRIKLVCICTINGFFLPKFKTLMMTKSQTQQRTTPKGLTVRHCNLFSCSNSLRLQVHCDTSSKNTVAHSTFERLDHHDISKIVILPHKSHVSHKYKCMNDGFFINQRADQKKFVRAEHHSM